MKQQLSPKAIAAAIAGVAALLLIGAFVLFKDSFAPTPTVDPKPWGPPGQWAGAPAGGAMGAGQPGATTDPAARFGGAAGGAMGAGQPGAPVPGAPVPGAAGR